MKCGREMALLIVTRKQFEEKGGVFFGFLKLFMLNSSRIRFQMDGHSINSDLNCRQRFLCTEKWPTSYVKRK